MSDCRGIASPDCPAVSQIVDSLDEIQYLTELNDADVNSVQSIFEDRCLHALLSVHTAATAHMVPLLSVCILEMDRMSDYDIWPKPKVWVISPNKCQTFG